METVQDVSLIIDGVVFKAKKEVLCEYSDYFRAMFSGNYIEKEQHEIIIDMLNPDLMAIILKYMDIGLITLSDHSLSTIEELAMAANFLQITELIKQIEYHLELELTLENMMDTIETAKRVSFLKLEQYCVMYGLFSFKQMKPQFIPTVEKLYWYLSHPHLNTETELDVFQFGLQWIKHMGKGPDALMIVLCCLDFNRITHEDLEEITYLVKEYVNSLLQKVVTCLYKLAFTSKLSLTSITEEKSSLSEKYTEKVYAEVLNLVKDSVQRKLVLTPAVPLLPAPEAKEDNISTHYLYTFTKEEGFKSFLEVSERNVWGWSVTSWGPTKIIVVGGERGRGTGIFMRDVHEYDIVKKEWIKHGVQLPQRRHGGIAIVGDSLFIVGGVGGFRVTLDTAIVYDLKQRSFRKIAKIPDAIQSPAICCHNNSIYAAGYKHIYKYVDYGQRDTWLLAVETDMRPNCLISYKGYIYVTQSYYADMFRFRPGVDKDLKHITRFTHAPAALLHMGDRLLVFVTSHFASEDVMVVEEYTGTIINPHLKDIVWSQDSTGFNVNDFAGNCVMMMTVPPINYDVPPHHKRYLNAYQYV